MAFVISKPATFFWPVKVELAVDNGKYEKQSFDAEFKRLPQSKIEEIVGKIRSEEITSDVLLARDLIVGWRGVLDDQGNEVPFSEAMKDQLLDVPTVASSIVSAFFEATTKAKLKN